VKPKATPQPAEFMLSKIPAEPDLEEHGRLIDRALTRNFARYLARVPHEVAAPHWVVLVSAGAAVLLIASVTLFVTVVFVLR
jgi:hypothetical protein